MMCLIFFFDTLQDADGFLLCGFLHAHRLKPALQRGIPLHVFAVFGDRSGTDQLNLSPGQGRFQNIGRVYRSLRAACSDDRMHLIQKQDHLPLPERADWTP